MHVYVSKILIDYDGPSMAPRIKNPRLAWTRDVLSDFSTYNLILPRSLIHSLPDIRRAHTRITLPGVRTSTTYTIVSSDYKITMKERYARSWYMDLWPSVDFDSFCAMYIAPTASAIALTQATA